MAFRARPRARPTTRSAANERHGARVRCDRYGEHAMIRVPQSPSASPVPAAVMGGSEQATRASADGGAAAGGPVARLAESTRVSFTRQRLRTWAYLPTQVLPSLRALSSLEAEGFSAENQMWSSSIFRKMHIERAEWTAGGQVAQVFHCVCFPWEDFPAPAPPLLSLDVVMRGEKITLAVADLCPASPRRELPASFQDGIDALQSRYRSLLAARVSRDDLPAWCREIFSDSCVLVRPAMMQSRPRGPEAAAGASNSQPSRPEGSLEDEFISYSRELVDMYLETCDELEAASTALPDSDALRRARNASRETAAAHHEYCRKQLENDKTFKVLEGVFGRDVAGSYMRKILFDAPAPGEVERGVQDFAGAVRREEEEGRGAVGGEAPLCTLRGGRCIVTTEGGTEMRVESWNSVAVLDALRELPTR